MMRDLLIIKTGSTLPELKARRGDFEDWILAGMGLGDGAARVVDVTLGAPLPGYAAVAGVVVTGSHSMVTEREAWSEGAAQWLAGAAAQGLPTLGICYGHQLLAHALGGDVGDNPRGCQYGTVTVELTPAAQNDPLLGGLAAPLRVQVSHVQSVLRLPPGAVRLAADGWDENQAFRVGESAWGVQFHPECDADIARAYLGHMRARLIGEGQDPDRLIAACADTPVGGEILKRFAQLCRRRP